MSRIYSKPVVSFLPLLFLLCPSSCVRPRGVPGAEYAVIQVKDGTSTGVETKRIRVYQKPNPKPPVPRPTPPLPKTSSVIDQWIKDPRIPDQQREEILIGLLPPDPKLQQDAKTYMDSFEAERLKPGGQDIRRYGSIFTFSLTLTVGALRGPLPSDPRIRYIEPNRVPLTKEMIPSQGASGSTCKGEAGYSIPPPSSVATIQTIGTRANLHLFANPPAAAVAMLDSGVNSPPLLPAAQIFRQDCMSPPCVSVSVGNDSCANHGTPNAGILIASRTSTGTSTEPQGVLQGAALHSFKVWQGTGGAGSCSNFDARVSAVVESLNVAIPAIPLNPPGTPRVDLILTETLIPGPANSSVAVAVDAAFDAGYPVIVAANPDPMMAPGNAHKGFLVSTTPQKSTTSDARLIPIVWSESNSETTSGSTSPLCKQDGASGAAPYVAAAAAKLRQLLRSNMQPDAPGNVYALTLALARPVNVIYRMLFLPASGQYLTGSFDITHGGEAYAEVNVQFGQQLRAAIWWPESASMGTGAEIHNEIRLEIGKPSGFSGGKAVQPTTSVFQYLPLGKALEAGTWIIKITGANVVAGPQRVYWAAFTGP
jgi:hypothetical protein